MMKFESFWKFSSKAASMQQATENRSAGFIAAMLALGVLAPTTFLGVPGIVGEVARQWGFGEAALGMAVLAEICAMSIGTLLAGLALSGQPVRRLLAAAVLLAAFGNALTPTAEGFATYVALRAVAGLGAGAIGAISMRYLSYTGQPERQMGSLVMGQTLWAAALLWLLLPALGTFGGAGAIYGCLAVLFASALAALSLFDGHEPLSRAAGPARTGMPGAAPGVQPRGTWLTLLALFALYGGVGVVWTFAEHIGSTAGLSPGFVAAALGAANLASVAVCALLPRVAHGPALRGWAEAMIATCALAVAALALPMSPVSFVAVFTLFVCSWTGSGVLLFATMPRYDSVGHHAALSPGFLGLGFGIGSTAGGALIGSSRLAVAIGGATAACVLALVLYALLRTGEAPPHLASSLENKA